VPAKRPISLDETHALNCSGRLVDFFWKAEEAGRWLRVLRGRGGAGGAAGSAVDQFVLGMAERMRPNTSWSRFGLNYVRDVDGFGYHPLACTVSVEPPNSPAWQEGLRQETASTFKA
jgi:hypothetical protein